MHFINLFISWLEEYYMFSVSRCTLRLGVTSLYTLLNMVGQQTIGLSSYLLTSAFWSLKLFIWQADYTIFPLESCEVYA